MERHFVYIDEADLSCKGYDILRMGLEIAPEVPDPFFPQGLKVGLYVREVFKPDREERVSEKGRIADILRGRDIPGMDRRIWPDGVSGA